MSDADGTFRRVRPLARWELAATPPDAESPPASGWLVADAPGGVASALAAAGLATDDIDASDWWWRCRVDDLSNPNERLTLRFGGVTPPAEILLNGDRVATVESMFQPVTIPLREPGEITVRCRAVGPWLAQPRRPRARWRTAVADNGLRFLRTTLIGRAPGFAPGPPTVGLWRPAAVVTDRQLSVDDLRVTAALAGDDGSVTASADVQALGETQLLAVDVRIDGPGGSWTASMTGPVRLSGAVCVPNPQRWWPHTHGDPIRYRVTLVIHATTGTYELPAGHVGFRSLAPGPPSHNIGTAGLSLHINEVPVFARGAVWTRPGGVTEPTDLRRLLEQVRSAGMNMLRVPGTWVYETDEFYDLCDELGILVWQDAMLANFDYPETEEFLGLLRRETDGVLARLAGRPSFTVFCGGSEVEQQAAMMGRDPQLALGRTLTEVLPASLRDSGADAIWVTNSPSGGALPFRNSTGVAHYFGVGGYRRPLSDARTTGVRFASECLAISNVPADETVDRLATETPRLLDSELWRAGTPRDRGADWDFGDVRDFYLGEYYAVDPAALRRDQPERYLQLAAQLSGEIMAEVFGEWRRSASPCQGGLILWLSDLLDGPGWGLIDRRGIAKPALGILGRTLQPVALWLTDEGLDGIGVHLANDGHHEVTAQLRVALYSEAGAAVDGAELAVTLAPRSQQTEDVEALIGHFADAAVAYRFGPAAHVAVVAELDTGDLRRRAIRFPGTPPIQPLPAAEAGLEVSVLAGPPTEDTIGVSATSQRVLHGVTVSATGYDADDVGFFLEPHREHLVRLNRRTGGDVASTVRVTAINLAEPILVPVPSRP